MRKIVAYILLLSLLILTSGCSQTVESPDAKLPASFESNFNADYGNLKLSGHISKLETGICTITITDPKGMDGITFTYIGGEISANIGGISVDTDVSNLPIDGFIKSVAQSLDTISKSGVVTITKADGYNRYCALDNICVLQEQDSGNVVSLVVTNADISMNFIDFNA